MLLISVDTNKRDAKSCRQSQLVLPVAAPHMPARRAASLGGGALEPLPEPHALALHARRHGRAPVLSPPLSYNDMVHMPGSKYRCVASPPPLCSAAHEGATAHQAL